ncbi:uncharacterized protein LOC143078128 [Mytilus galloprovincialis]|uniref:uncharacterized protein LOC143078128 n=1 Tax=Mytilus galloprovincialis TaxID=29158 RepID=UPI003F7CB94F
MEILQTWICLGLLGFIQSLLLNRNICDDIMYVDCKTEALPGNKLYRDNNGNIYDNFCTYSQEKCRDSSIDLEAICTCVHPMILSPVTPALQIRPLTPKQKFFTTLAVATFATSHIVSSTVKPTIGPLTVKSTMGPLTVKSTMGPLTVTPTTDQLTVKPTMGPLTMKSTMGLLTVKPTVGPLTVKQTMNLLTMKSTMGLLTVKPTMGPTMGSTTVKPTMGPPTQDAVTSLFCQQRDVIVCSNDQEHMCGSDNTTYKNRCEFTKAQCDNPNLSIVREGDC